MTRAGVVLACLLLAGCGAQAETHHNPGTGHEVSTSVPAPVAGEARAEITIAAGKVEPPPGWLELTKGQPVALTVTSDVADELHVHGFDIPATLVPGQPVTVRFKADRTGVFEVETHDSKLVLLQLRVR